MRVVLVMLVALGACRAAVAPPPAPAPKGATIDARPVKLGLGLTLAATPRIVDLEGDATFRWVPPDSLVGGLTSEDRRAAGGALAAGFRTTIETVLRSHRWAAAADSAAYDLTLFEAARFRTATDARTETVDRTAREQLECDATRTRAPGPVGGRCPPRVVRTTTSTAQVSDNTVVLVIRRRSDAATRAWLVRASPREVAEAVIARDLIALLDAGDR